MKPKELKNVAWSAYQVLGALWGITRNPEKQRIMEWFYAVAHEQAPEYELFPIRTDALKD